jgi:hypothetical protein
MAQADQGNIDPFMAAMGEGLVALDDLQEHLANAIARLNETRAHIALANKSLAVLLALKDAPANSKTAS